MTTVIKGRLRRSNDPPGYWLGDEFRPGFGDDPTLPDGFRRRIATWARAAGNLSDAQRDFLARQPDVTTSDAQRHARELAGPQASPMWDFLSEKERGLVLHPASHLRLANASYPISIGQLATLTGSTENQLRHWHELGLLRARRTRGGHRKFYANAALRAFFLRSQMPQSYITVLRDVQSFKGGPFLAGLATILQEQADDFDPSDRDLFAHTANDLERLSLAFARRSGALSASSFQHISSDDWASLNETPKPSRRATASRRASAR
jgi:hypothetical protein